MESQESLQDQIQKERSAILIINTKSRQGEKLVFRALQLFADHQIKIVASYPVRKPSQLAEITQKVIEQGHKLIIVGGGDGTITSVVDYFAYKDVVLGILPLGTGNSFARTLGLPLSLESAIEVIAKGKIAKVDLGKVGNDYFTNTVSIGFTVDVARKITRKLKRWFGLMSYVFIGIQVFLSHQPFLCKLTIDGKEHRVSTHQVIIANGRFFGIFPVIPNVRVGKHELVVFTMDTLTRFDAVRFWFNFYRGNFKVFSKAGFYRAKKVVLEPEKQKYVDIDGETETKTPVEITFAPDALMVMVPDNFEKK